MIKILYTKKLIIYSNFFVTCSIVFFYAPLALSAYLTEYEKDELKEIKEINVLLEKRNKYKDNKSLPYLFITNLIGKQYLYERMLEKAQKEFEIIMSNSDGYLLGESNYYLGIIYYSKRKYHKAYEYFDTATFSSMDDLLKKDAIKKVKKIQLRKETIKEIENDCKELRFEEAFQKSLKIDLQNKLYKHVLSASNSKKSFFNAINKIKRAIENDEFHMMNDAIHEIEDSYSSLRHLKYLLKMDSSKFHYNFEILHNFWLKVSNFYSAYIDAKKNNDWVKAQNELSKILDLDSKPNLNSLKKKLNELKDEVSSEQINQLFDEIYSNDDKKQRYIDITKKFPHNSSDYKKLFPAKKEQQTFIINYFEGKKEQNVQKLEKALKLAEEKEKQEIKLILGTLYLNDSNHIISDLISEINPKNYWNDYTKLLKQAKQKLNQSKNYIENEEQLIISNNIEKLEQYKTYCNRAENYLIKSQLTKAQDNYNSALDVIMYLPGNIKVAFMASEALDKIKLLKNKNYREQAWNYFKDFQYMKALDQFKKVFQLTKDEEITFRIKHIQLLIKAKQDFIENKLYSTGCFQKDYDNAKADINNFFSPKRFWYPSDSTCAMHKHHFLYLNEVAVGDCFVKRNNNDRALLFYESAKSLATTDDEKNNVLNKIEKIKGKNTKVVIDLNNSD